MTVDKEVIAYGIFKPIFSSSFCEKISGKVTDNNNKPLQSVTVSLLQAKDRCLVKAAVIAANGGFEFTSKKESSFLLSYSQVWFENKYEQMFIVNERENYTVKNVAR